MMLKRVWVFFFSCVVFGMWMIYEFGIQPKSVRVIRPSFFEKSEDLGHTTFAILRPRLLLHDVVSFGQQLGVIRHQEVLKGFIESAQKEARHFDVVINIGALPLADISYAPAAAIDLSTQPQTLAAEITKALEQKKRVLVIGNTLDILHFVPSSDILPIEQELRKKIISIGAVELYGVPTMDGSVDTKDPIEPCEQKSKYQHTLGCVIKNKIEFLKSKKNIKWDKVIGVMDQEGERDFVLFTN